MANTVFCVLGQGRSRTHNARRGRAHAFRSAENRYGTCVRCTDVDGITMEFRTLNEIKIHIWKMQKKKKCKSQETIIKKKSNRRPCIPVDASAYFQSCSFSLSLSLFYLCYFSRTRREEVVAGRSHSKFGRESTTYTSLETRHSYVTLRHTLRVRG